MTAKLYSLFVVLLLFLFSAPAAARRWNVQTSGMDTSLRGVSAVYVPDAKANHSRAPVVWVSGSKGVILKSLDEGKTWQRLHVADGDTLDFRGIVAFDASTAYLMSSGDGDKSRIYKTRDGGETWKLQYSESRKEFFLDSIACFSKNECLALGDPIDGKFVLLKTNDGEHWSPLRTDKMPPALGGEGAFAASNSCIALYAEEEIFFATGGPAARVFHSTDGGQSWTVARTPIVQGNTSSGIFAIALDTSSHLIAVGGDYKEPGYSERVAAYLFGNPKTWQLASQQPNGFRSAVAFIGGERWVAVGPGGEDISMDGGIHWRHTDSLNLNAVAILDEEHGWAVGPNGTIAKWISRPAKPQ